MKRILARKTPNKIGKEVRLLGWVNSVRDHGKISFIDLRDRTGIVQCVGQKLGEISSEYVVEIIGKVARKIGKSKYPDWRSRGSD